MSKKRKFISMIVVVVIAISQLFVLVQGASYQPYWNVEMPNWQTQVVLGSGEKGNPDHQYTQISCTGGTVNKITAIAQLANGSNISKNWVEIEKNVTGGTAERIPHNQYIGKGTGMKVMAYQKNVLSKTASGSIWF